MQVAGGRGRLTRLDDGMIRLTWQPGTIVEVEDARNVLESSFLFVDSVPYAILIDLGGIFSISTAASYAFADDHRVLAAAMLGDTPMDRVLAAQSSRAIHSTRLFSSEPDAIAWLAGYLREE